MSDIRITAKPQQAAAKADEVKSAVGRLEGYFDTMSENVNGSALYWQGEASETHRRVYSQKLPVIHEILARLSEHAADLKNIALNYESAEKEIEDAASALPEDVIL